MAVNVFELFAKIGLNDTDYKKKLDESESKISKFAGALQNGLTTAAKVGGAALGAAATAVASLTKASIENYAEYEQLVGGAELMFGKAYDKVAENAKNAYKTVQMSQNEYLQQVNGFATGLKTALNGNETAAADLAHKIVQAEADVIAATGNTAENVQNAFNGIMKSNFTMLDNLQIGITPTKEGFQEVIDKVNAWNETQGNATKYQMGNLADMQAALVDYIDMVGMKGYAESEAARTIQGSLASTKAAYSNLLTGLADDNANFEELVNNLVTAIAGDGTASNPGLVGNIIPRVQTALGGVGGLISGLAPVIGEQIPVLVSDLLPGALDGAMSIFSALGSALPGLLDSISGTLIVAGADLTAKLGEGISDGGTLERIVESAITLITVLGTTLLDQAPMLLSSAVDIIITLAKGITDATPDLLPTVVDVIIKIAEMLTDPSTLTNILDAALDIILQLGLGLADAAPELVDAAVKVITNLVEFLVNPENIGQILSVALELIIALGGALVSSIPSLLESVGEIILAIVDNFRETDWSSLGKDLVEGFKGGIENAWSNLKEWFTGLFGDLIGVAKKILGIASPSKEFEEIGRFTDEGLAKGIENNSDKVYKQMEKIVKKIKEYFDEIQTYFDTSMDIAELEYEMWELTEGLDASEAEKAAKKIELLNKQLSDQKQIVDASNTAYQEMVKLYGEGSVQAMEYKKQLLEEQVEYQKMQNELNETNQSYKDLSRTQKGWARVAVDAVKAVSQAIKETAEVSDSAVEKNEETTNRIGENINELIDLFKSGKAKTNISNARDLRGVSYG